MKKHKAGARPSMRLVYRVKGEQHAVAATLAMQSVRRHIHGADIVVYADQPYAVFADLEVTVHVRPEIFSKPFMVADLLCVHEALKQARKTATLVMFVDSDVIVRKSFTLPDLDFDFCVTYRDPTSDLFKLQPYNFGVWWARPTDEAVWGSQWMIERCLLLQDEYHRWYGNQIALRELVGPIRPEGARIPLGNGAVLRVKMLPCATWNFSPEAEGEDVSDKIAVHCKGPSRKPFIEHYLAEALR